jgi:hypothetical protein
MIVLPDNARISSGLGGVTGNACPGNDQGDGNRLPIGK